MSSDASAPLAQRVSDFIREEIIPIEERELGLIHTRADGDRIARRDLGLREDLLALGRSAGLLTPQLPVEWGGLGIDALTQADVFEAGGYSLLGPLALNIAAPDEGNMHMIERVASTEQKERWLRPLASGEIRSAFAMTEPAPGTGSDPRALTTRAERAPGCWRIDGEKWFITGARDADVVICMARTSGERGSAGGATMFLVPGGTKGMDVVRDVGTVDAAFFGGHSVVRFDGCVVPDDAVLGEVDEGFRYAQVRLAPARLTHCMRWLGLAGRAHDIALGHVTEREGFGSRIADLGLAQQHIADSEIDLAASRSLIRETARLLDAGEDAGTASSVAKTFVAEAVGRIVDRSVQLAGGQGVSDELLLSRYWREVRPFRIYDGSSETHRWSIAKRAVSRFRKGMRHDLPR